MGDAGIREWTSLAVLDAIDIAEEVRLMWHDKGGAASGRGEGGVRGRESWVAAAARGGRGGLPPRATTEHGCGVRSCSELSAIHDKKRVRQAEYLHAEPPRTRPGGR
jgi:hypothetical protein